LPATRKAAIGAAILLPQPRQIASAALLSAAPGAITFATISSGQQKSNFSVINEIGLRAQLCDLD
jgi:hypothetical protein